MEIIAGGSVVLSSSKFLRKWCASKRIDRMRTFVFLCFLFSLLVMLIYNKRNLRTTALNAIHRIDLRREDLTNKTSNFVPYSADELSWALAKASMPNKTVIVTYVNAAWMEPNGIFDLFKKSFHEGEGTEPLLRYLLVVAMDNKAYCRCLQVHRHCHRLITAGVDFTGEKSFMTQDYLKMTHNKILFLQNIAERGYSFVYSDADVVWFRNPFERFSYDSDIEMSSDHYHGGPFDMSTPMNTGFMFFRSNERTVRVLELWYTTALMRPGKHDQNVFKEVKLSRNFRGLGVKMRFLDTLHFSGFCEAPGDLKAVCTMHASCCKGLKAKVYDLTNTLEDWALFRSSRGKKSRWRHRSQCIHSWPGRANTNSVMAEQGLIQGAIF